jgi:5-methylcytosine-specific restriction endonuclease McrA
VEDYERIFDIYAEARRLSVETGIPHEVDHILPIKGYHLSGLHVPWNLRILTKTENMKAWGHHLKEAKAMGITERIK